MMANPVDAPVTAQANSYLSDSTISLSLLGR